MTTDFIPSTPVPPGKVRGEVLDAVTDEMVHARGPAARAEIIVELIQEMCATVEWLHATGTELDSSQADELTSITRLSRVAQDHRRRMRVANHTARPTAVSRVRRLEPSP